MRTPDHAKTGSYKSSRAARDYRAREKKMIDNGDYDGAIDMGVRELREKFGRRYEKGIRQMLQERAKELGR